MTWEGLSPPYATIVADPPWPHREFVQMHSRAGRTVKPAPYALMSLADIYSLPVWDLSDDDSRLFLWTTNHYLPHAFGVLDAWGFTYKQTTIWHKEGNPSPWGGSVAPNHAEFLLVAVRGNPPRLDMWKSNVVPVNVTRHSVKPATFLDLIERVSPGPYVELFARQPRLGWDHWGHGYETGAA